MALGFFNPTKDPNVDLETRRKIALALMSRNRKFPTNLGEGIASVGQEIGDALAARALMEENAAANVAGDRVLEKYTGGPRPAVEPTTYAPPASVPPAVAAINAAAPQGAPIVPAPPPQARTLVPPTAPSGGAVPVAAGPGGMVEPGEFNEIDAADPRNRYRAPPAYLAAALERNIVDPERRGYLGQLAGREAQSAGEVSPTGAAGPFQFTRGTGAQYGIPGDARFDPDASTRAANAFTNDNVATLTAKLGREPTPSEMALAHQQGAGTAGNMLTGAGNAPANNLAVNNVPPGLGPQAAAQKIMGYYGMPGATGVPASPRDAIAEAVVAQQGGGRPSVGDYGQKLALAATPQQPIPAAPPQQQIRAAPPPQQVAQTQANPLVPPLPPELANLTPPRTMTDVQRSILQDIQNTPPAHREAVENRLKRVWDQEQDKIKQEHEAYKEKLAVKRAIETEQYKLTAGAPKTAAEIDKIRHEIATGKIIQSEGRIFRVENDGTVKDVTPGQTGEGPPQIKMTQDQSDTLKFYKMGKTAAAQLEGKERILAEGWGQELLGKVPFAGNKLLSSQYRAAKNAAGLLVQADLRDTSGATIGTQEFKDRFDLLIPKSGDDALAQKNKTEARKAVLEGQRLALGSARPMADYVDKEHAKERAEKAASLNREMEGKDKNKTYEKNGVFRKWVGDHWEEH